MKKFIVPLIVIVLIATLGLAVYFYQNQQKANNDEPKNNTQQVTQKDVRQDVWEQFTPQQQEYINGTWQDGTVITIGIEEGSLIVIDGEIVKGAGYAGQEVYMIDFPTKNMGVPNNMIVYADMDTHKLIGYGLVD